MIQQSSPQLKHRDKQGFTLIELLVVVSIIGLLGSIVMASLSIARFKGRDARRESDVQQIVNAMEQYYADNQHYPCSEIIRSHEANFLQELVDGGYLSDNPTDPLHPSVYYEYFSFRDEPGDMCGTRGFFLGTYPEDTDTCSFNGLHFDYGHCHIMFPTPMNCDEPWDLPDAAGLDPTCAIRVP